MRGDLGRTAAADLCRGLADDGATGVVTIAHASGEAGIHLREGTVYWAESPAPRARLGDRLVNAALLTPEQLVGALRSQAESSEHVKLGALLVEQELVTRDVIRVFVQEQILDALFEIMGWDEGSYEFIPSPPTAEDRLPVELSVDQMLVEVARRQSEWNQIQARIGSLDTVPDFVSGGSSAAAALEPDEFAVLASVDGRRSIRDLADDLGYSEFEAARIVYGLALLGIVDVRTDDDTATGPEDDAEAATGAAAGLELDLGALDAAARDAHDDEADEAAGRAVDVAAALEEAIEPDTAVPAVEQTPARPQVRIHGGPGGFQWDTLDGPVEDHSTPPPPPPAPPEEPDDVSATLAAALAAAANGPAVAEDPDEVEVREPDPSGWDLFASDAGGGHGAAADPPVWDDAAADEPASGGSSGGGFGGSPFGEAYADDESIDEPEPFVLSAEDLDAELAAEAETGDPEAAGTGDPEAETGDAEGTDEPGAPIAADLDPDEDRVPGADLDDSDFDRLLDELAGTGGVTPAAQPYTSTPPTPATPPSGDQPSAEPRGGGDVSEFLRELSRLAVDDEDDGGRPAPSGSPQRSDAQQAADAAADARRSGRDTDDDDDGGRRRGLFGRKR